MFHSCSPLLVHFERKSASYVAKFIYCHDKNKQIYFDKYLLEKLKSACDRFDGWEKNVPIALSKRTFVFKLKNKVIIQHHSSRLSPPEENHTIRLLITDFKRLVITLPTIIALLESQNDLFDNLYS